MPNETQSADHLLTTGLYDAEEQKADSDLYFIRSSDGSCKVGRARNVQSRFATIQNASPYRLWIEMTLPGLGWQEKVWHTAFRADRITGEWFKWSDGLARAVGAARGGEEWIATLDPPGPMAPGLGNVWREQTLFLADQSAESVAAFLWRNHIADMEEEAAPQTFLPPLSHSGSPA